MDRCTLTATTDQAIPSICIDCRYIGKRPSGIAEFVRGLIDNAPQLAPDLEFHLLKSPEAPEVLNAAENVTEHVVRAGTNHPLSMWFLPQIAPLAQCDLFHATANFLPAQLTMKSVVSIHDIMWLDNPEWCDAGLFGPVKTRYFGHGIRRALTSANCVAAISEATRHAILARYPEAEDRLSLTRPGVHERFQPVPRDDAMLAGLGIDKDTRFALVVGQHAPYKNHEGALRAFALAQPGLGDTKLVFVQRRGPGPERLRTVARELGIAEDVLFTGPIEEDALIQLYSSAHLLLHPSLCEGFGNPLAEAMACGCPVITSNVSAMPEVTGEAARLVDPHDIEEIAMTIAKLWHDAKRLEAMRAAGLERAGELRWIDFARANVAIYRSLLGSG